MESLENFFHNRILKMKKEDLLILFTIFGVGIINYFYFLTHTVLTPDGLTYGPIYLSGGWEFDLGRPLLVLVDRLRGGLVSPPIILFFSLLYLSISAMLIRRIFPIKKKFYIFLLSLLIVLFPTFSESSLFIYCFDSYCIAFLSSILGIYFIQHKKYVLSILSIVISLSLYQAYISVTISGVLLLFILDTLDKKSSFKNLIIQMVTIFIGLVAYFVMLKLGMFVLGRHLADYKGASSFGINTLLSLPKSILNAYSDFYSFLVLEGIIYNRYFFRVIINLVIVVVMIGILFPVFKSINSYQKFLLILSILILPITINIMDLIACDTRMNLVTGIGFIMFYLLFLILIEKYSTVSLLRSITAFLLIVLCYTYLLSNNGTFMARNDTFQNYYTQSTNYLSQAKELDGYRDDLPWMFNNVIEYQSPLVPVSNGYLAKDLETFYNYLGITENEDFYRRFLGQKISVVSEEQYRLIIEKETFQSMKVGDVQIIDGVIAVKVSENNL